MATYTYVARDSLGNMVRGEEDVDTPDALVQALQRKSLFVVKVQKKARGISKGGEVELPEWAGGGQVKKKELTVITRQLGTLMKAGVSLVGAMEALEAQANTGAMRKLIRHVREQVETGMPVGDAFAEKEDKFGELYVNLVRAGDQTGTLPETMQSLADHLERSGKIAGKIKGALMYPVTVLMLALGIAWFLLTNIVPQFAEILTSMDAELPKITEITLALSDILQNRPLEIGLGVLGTIAFFVLSHRNEKGKSIYHLLFTRIPIVKLLFNGSSVASFASAFNVALRSGLPVLDALEIAQRVVGNRVMRKALMRVRADVSRGEPVSRSMKDFPVVFPSIFISMLRSGEDAGNLEAMVENAQDYYQTEVDQAVENLTTMLEPVMIVLLGGLIAVIMLSLFLPMWGAMGSLQ